MLPSVLRLGCSSSQIFFFWICIVGKVELVKRQVCEQALADLQRFMHEFRYNVWLNMETLETGSAQPVRLKAKHGAFWGVLEVLYL